MNTKIEYLYRDGSNYSIYCEEVLSGTLTKREISEIVAISFLCGNGTPFAEITEADIDEMSDYLETDMPECYFYPDACGLPAKTFVSEGYNAYDDDPDWHELSDISETEQAPTCDVSAADFLAAFRSRAAVNLMKAVGL